MFIGLISSILGLIMFLLLIKLVLILSALAIIIAIVSFAIMFVYFNIKKLRETLAPVKKYVLPKHFSTFMEQIIYNPNKNELLNELISKE